MSSDMAEAIRQLIEEKGFSEESVKISIENSIKAAYKKTFGTSDNCEVEFSDDLSRLTVWAKKVIVDGVYDPVTEIELEDARKLSDEDFQVGDEIKEEIDPKSFERSAVQTGKQIAHEALTDIQKDTLYAEYKEKVGEIILGYYERAYKDTIYVNLGGKVEGVLPKKFQSEREVYRKGDRIKAIIVDLKKTKTGLQVILSRTDPNFVRNILELEVPEIYDKTVEIHKIVREAGYRTKVAVSTNREDIDPVGSCVGLKGVRIKNVIQELEGEKIDVLKYDDDPREFIKNALSPAEVIDVIILDESKRQALAVVAESQLSLAIGKQGLNVRLANKLTDWSIDVKTEEQCEEADLLADSRKAAEELFNDRYDQISTVAELPGINPAVAELLSANNITGIEDFIEAQESGALNNIEGLTEDDITAVRAIIDSSVEFVDEEEEAAAEATENAAQEGAAEATSEEEEEVYECPECHARITTDMTVCPNCGIGLSFEYEDEE